MSTVPEAREGLGFEGLYAAFPPYEALSRHPLGYTFPSLPPGAIIVVHAPLQESSWLLMEVRRLTRAHPGALLAVGTPVREALLFRRLQDLGKQGASSILPTAGEPDLDEVLDAARQASAYLDELPLRLRICGIELVPDAWQALKILVQGDSGWDVDDWARASGLSERSLQRLFPSDTLARPLRWVQLVRTIRAVQSLQLRPWATVESLLGQAGFGNSQSGRAAVQRLCGHAPEAIRSLIGWYWVPERWLTLCREEALRLSLPTRRQQS